MMSDQYQQTFTTTDGQNNVTYIQFVNPAQSQIIYCKEEINEEYCYDESVEETLEESYIEEDPIGEEDTIEVLEEVVVERKKNNSRATTSSDHHVTKKLVQVTGWSESFFCTTLQFI